MVAKEDVLGYAVDSCGVVGCVNDVVRRIESGDWTGWLACLNPHSYVLALSDRKFSDALRDADWLIPDGIGLVLASRWLRGGIRERVTGSDIFSGVHERLSQRGGYSVFFLGSTEETLAEIRAQMRTDFPDLRVAGTYSPPFSTAYTAQENEAIVAAVNLAAPDVLWVGMTAPKQEKWIFENRARLNVKFAGAVGAVFDFYSGRVKRSHPVFQRLGLEWLPRLIREPRRLWRRMFVSAPWFAWHVLRWRLRSADR